MLHIRGRCNCGTYNPPDSGAGTLLFMRCAGFPLGIAVSDTRPGTQPS